MPRDDIETALHKQLQNCYVADLFWGSRIWVTHLYLGNFTRLVRVKELSALYSYTLRLCALNGTLPWMYDLAPTCHHWRRSPRESSPLTWSLSWDGLPPAAVYNNSLARVWDPGAGGWLGWPCIYWCWAEWRSELPTLSTKAISTCLRYMSCCIVYIYLEEFLKQWGLCQSLYIAVYT